jgi:hypothetical protein
MQKQKVIDPIELSQLVSRKRFKENEKSILRLAIEQYSGQEKSHVEPKHKDHHNDSHSDHSDCICVIGGL